MIESVYTPTEYTGTGSQTTFAIGFEFRNSAWIRVTTNDGSTDTELVPGVDFAVVGVNVECTAAPANGDKVVISLESDYLQETNYLNTGALDLENIEKNLDDLTLTTQELKNLTDRSVKTDITSDETPDELLQSIYDARDGAQESANAAAVSESSASNSADDALASENKAQEWAINPEDDPVETGPDRFSALHWAAKAAESAAGVNLPAITSGDSGKMLVVNSDETGYDYGGYLGQFKNKIINGNCNVNQRAVSGTVVLAAGEYGHDRWKAGSSGCTYTFTKSAGVTTITVSAGSLLQIIEGDALESGTHVMSWVGTLQFSIGGGTAGGSGVTGTATAGTNLTVETSGIGTMTKVQLEKGLIPTNFELRHPDQEKELCYGYFQKSYDENVAPGTATLTGYFSWWLGTSGGPTLDIVTINGLKPMRSNSPTLTIYDLAGTSGVYTSDAGNGAAITTIASYKDAIYIQATTPDRAIQFQWTREDEL